MSNQLRNSCSGFASFVVFSCIFSVSTQTFAAIGTDELPSQNPLFMIEGVASNLHVTLDDVQSMGQGYAPFGVNEIKGLRGMHSQLYNKLYYNPDYNYPVPKKVTYENGKLKVEDYVYGVDYHFNAAPRDGFKPSETWTYDLEKDYKAKAGANNCTYPNEPCNEAHYYRKKTSDNCKVVPQVFGVGANWDEVRRFDKECYEYVRIKDTGQDQERNFATWYSFYSQRYLAVRSIANLVMLTLPDNVRVSWSNTSTCMPGDTSRRNSCGPDQTGRVPRAFTDQRKANFMTWLRAGDVSMFSSGKGYEPTAQGGRVYDVIKDLATVLGKRESYQDLSGETVVCRANYHLLFTSDGATGTPINGAYWDFDDSYKRTLPDGTIYNPGLPYKGVFRGDLADLAFKNWATNLFPEAGKDAVAPYMPYRSGDSDKDYWNPRNNPATWPHLVHLTVGLGFAGSFNIVRAPVPPRWDPTSNTPTFDTLHEGGEWPKIPSLGPLGVFSVENAYDIWHMAVNSRGEFFDLDDPEKLIELLRKAMEQRVYSLTSTSTTGSGPAINSNVSETDEASYFYQASYASDQNWAGNLTAYRHTLNTSTNTIDKEKIWNAHDKNDWSGSKWRNRNIKMASTAGLTDFTWNKLSVEQRAWLNRDSDKKDQVDSLGSQRVDFIRGSRSGEGTTFRSRTSVLGDIINSKPVTVRGARLLTAYANGIEGKSKKYEGYVAAQKNRTPMIYVGANDGMLHGFNANTGVEMFAFVPSAVIKNLHHLTAASYGLAKHQFYVDGAIEVSDVYINGQWRTVLVGTLAAGGQGIYALDVTDPADIKLLWEFDQSKMSSGAKLGYTYAKPTIARLHNNKWAVVIGNGYAAEDSDNGKAALLLINIENGSLIRQLNVQGENGIANGLSTPKLADINGDGVADFAYAGDLQGNLWRFDLAPNNGQPNNPFDRPTGSNGEPLAGTFGDFKVSFGGTPLFSAKAKDGTRQAITAAPSLVRHPSNFGYIVVAGTGRYYSEGDKKAENTTTQSVYGIWDSTTNEASSASNRFGTISRANLQPQTLAVQVEASSNNQPARILSNHGVSWAERNPSTGVWTTGKVGWYLDFNLAKEMVVTDMTQLGRTLYFQTMVPTVNRCDAGLANWAYGIDPATGGRTLHHVWTDYRDNSDPSKLYSVIRLDGEGGLSMGYATTGDYQVHTGLGSANTQPDPQSVGRQNWRMIERD